MRRSRFKVGCFAGASIALSVLGFACIPHPDDDFSDFQKRVANLPKPVTDGATTFEAAPPPTDAVEGLYYGACMSELAFSDPNKIFNLFTHTKFTPSGAGGKLELSIGTLKIEPGPKPPSTVGQAGVVGTPFAGSADVDAQGKFNMQLGTVGFPGAANPISGSDVVILNGSLQGRFSAERFCARLGGHVEKPESATRDLNPPDNICQFVPVKDGDKTPTFSFADLTAAGCPD